MEIDDKYLGQVCKEVQPSEMGLMPAIIGSMLETCWRGKVQVAVGLAANQVGLDVRVIVLDYAGFRGGMINPEVTKYRGGTNREEEGCLSYGKRLAHPTRHKIITLQYLDEAGNLQRGKYRGLLARIIQHEIDHLDGISMFDREKIGAVK